jgi:hypothetical protein
MHFPLFQLHPETQEMSPFGNLHKNRKNNGEAAAIKLLSVRFGASKFAHGNHFVTCFRLINSQVLLLLVASYRFEIAHWTR